MRNEIDLRNLKEIYLISNTASFLYNSFINDEGVQVLASKHTTKELIDSFIVISKTEINDIADLVWAYALYVAILIKSDNDTFKFLEKEGAISFEWFIELKNIFLSRLRPENHFSFSQEIKTIPSNKVKEYSESVTQVFELS